MKGAVQMKHNSYDLNFKENVLKTEYKEANELIQKSIYDITVDELTLISLEQIEFPGKEIHDLNYYHMFLDNLKADDEQELKKRKNEIEWEIDYFFNPFKSKPIQNKNIKTMIIEYLAISYFLDPLNNMDIDLEIDNLRFKYLFLIDNNSKILKKIYERAQESKKYNFDFLTYLFQLKYSTSYRLLGIQNIMSNDLN